MLVKEYRMPLPFSVREYEIGQAYMIAKAAAEDSTSSDGVEMVRNEPFADGKGRKGQYTEKIFHIAQRLPKVTRSFFSSLQVVEKSYNAYPHCYTSYHINFFKSNFEFTVESIHKADRGTTENALELKGKHLKKRQVVTIDIANDSPKPKAGEPDPRTHTNEVAGTGPLGKHWIAEQPDNRVMTAYKVVTVRANVWPIQSTIEAFIQKLMRELLTTYHRKCFAWQDKWASLTMKDVRDFERETAAQLQELRSGTTVQQTQRV